MPKSPYDLGLTEIIYFASDSQMDYLMPALGEICDFDNIVFELSRYSALGIKVTCVG